MLYRTFLMKPKMTICIFNQTFITTFSHVTDYNSGISSSLSFHPWFLYKTYPP